MTDNNKPLTPQQRSGIGRPTRLTWDVFKAICALVEQTGVKYASCEAFGFRGAWVGERLKEFDKLGEPQWRDLWENSLELFADRLETEMARRAIDGYNEPVFYQGQRVGEIRKFSDQLAITLAKAHRPERFRDNIKLDAEISGGVLLVPQKMTVEEYLAEAAAPPSDQGGGD